MSGRLLFYLPVPRFWRRASSPSRDALSSGLFRLRVQPQLDKAADGLGATDLCIMHRDPGINCRNLLIVHTYDLRSTGDGIFHNAAE
jgi:hypothetical protein